MTIKYNHVFGPRASPRCGKPRRRERCGQGTYRGGCWMLRALGPPGPARAGRGHQACRATSPRSSCTARRQRHAGTPASFIGTSAGNNRTAVVSAPLRWGLFTSLVLGTESVPSSAPAAAQQERAADCFPGRRFPAGRKKRCDFPS